MKSTFKLFIVSFGSPKNSNSFSDWNKKNPEPLFVIADDFKMASEKAYSYMEKEREEVSILQEDGSLKQGGDEAIEINNIELVTNNLIW